jgi:UDP-N-acetylglucosamine 3-dehydrogenase
VAVIGIGFWGRNQVRIFSQLDQTKLVCVCDANESVAKTIGKQYAVPYVKELDSVLSRADIDAVTICTPTITHMEIARRALLAGKHVLVEKPMTSTVSEGKELLTLSQEKGLKLMPGHIERFNPAVKCLKSLVADGSLGEVMLLLARRVGRWPERIGDVGVVRDTAIHDIDLARYIFEDEVSVVYAKVGSMRHRNEDYSEIMLQFTNGGTAFIDANWLSPRKTRTLIVTGSEATAKLDYITQEVAIESSEKTVTPNLEKKEPLTLELTHFAESILNNQPFSVNGLDGLRAVEICEAVLRSSSAQKIMNLTVQSTP